MQKGENIQNEPPHILLILLVKQQKNVSTFTEKINNKQSMVCTLVIPAFGRLRQEDLG